MPYVRSAEAVVHEIHGVRFTAHANPGTGSKEVCAWLGEVPAGTVGVPHTVSKEEVLLVLSGALHVTLDGTPAPAAAGPGDAVLVPAGTMLQVGNPGSEPVAAWVTTSVGLEATTADGSVIRPPWTQ